MFEMLRSKAKIFYWVIAVSFILFGVVFSYGGATSGCQSDSGNNPQNVGLVGKVNGAELTGSQYENMYARIMEYNRAQSQGREINANQVAGARQQAWDQLVRLQLQTQAIADNKIEVSNAEILARFENNPPPALLQNYRDPETGAVDIQKYYADLQNPENDWSFAEEYVREVIQTEKLKSIITDGVAVSDDEVRSQYLAQNGKATAEYIGVLYSTLNSVYQPTDEEINAYFQSHGDDYLRKEKVSTKVVRFNKEASDADWQSALAQISEIRTEIENGSVTFADAAARYSEDGSASIGGDLGTFDRNRMVPEFTESSFSLDVGVISEPVRTKFGYHLIEVTEQHFDDETKELFEVTARHILLKVVASNNTVGLINDSAQNFADRVNGGNFVTTAEAEAMDLLSPEAFIEGRDIPGLPLSLAGSLWAHRANPGDVSPVFSNRDFFYVVLAGEKIPAGPADLDEVKSQVVLALQKVNNKNLASAQLSPAVGEIQMGRTMAEVSADTELAHALTDTFTYNGNVKDVGYGTDFNKLAIEGEVGTLVPEVETLRGLFALTPTWISAFDQADYDQRQVDIRSYLLSQAQNEKMEEFYTAMLEAADVEDYR